MDPNVIHEQPSLPEGGSHVDDSAAYLRRLRAQHLETALEAQANAGVSIPVDKSSTGTRERRRSERFLCSGSVEFKTEGSDVRMWGTLKDVSLHGCYVEMSTPFPVNTNVNVILESAGIRVYATATVRASYPFLGMGMCFTEMEPAQQLRLQRILATLAKQRAIFNGVSSEQPDPLGILASMDARACLEEVAEFFKKNAHLSRDEFYRIAQRVRRS